MKNIFRSMILASAIALAISPVYADQRIQDNLVIDGTTTPLDGVTGTGVSTTAVQPNPTSFHTCGQPAGVATYGVDSTPVTTEFYFAPVFIPTNMTLTGMSVFWGSASSGNAKVGLAGPDGAILATSASTAQAGTDAYQDISFTATVAVKGPQTYWALLFMDNNTVRYNAHPAFVGKCNTGKATGQVYATGFTAITTPTAVSVTGPVMSPF